MKALIFNSGYGKRMGEFTKTHHKSQALLNNGETIFHRQLRILSELGVKDFIVTTGPFKEQLEAERKKDEFKDLNFTFVENPVYDTTNYIYSMYLAREYIDDDMLILHGDLVFDKALVKQIIENEENNLATLNKTKELPEKDFKARLENGIITEVSISIFDYNCYAFQAFYKLKNDTVRLWLDKVSEFVSAENTGVYAENALNEISKELQIKPFLYDDYYIDEIDNLDDLARVKSEIRQFDFDEQIIFSDEASLFNLPDILKKEKASKPMIVSDCLDFLSCKEYLEGLDYDFVYFKSFSPNPKYEEVNEGVELYKKEKCDFLISIGGGSAIDTAKNIKLFTQLDDRIPYVKQEYVYSPIKHIAIPTTAGTGSESTRYSVVYYEGEKCSVTQDCIVPDYVILDSSLLKTLPELQKKCTLLDALGQCIEAIWSVNTNEKCREYAKKGIKLILENTDAYFENDISALNAIQSGANFSGKAINISQTTAGHALSYKLTSLYGIPHGYAVALCLIKVWRYMADLQEDNECLNDAFEFICSAFNVESIYEAIDIFEDLVFNKFKLKSPELKNKEDIEILSKSVNTTRLSNNPVPLDDHSIKQIYISIFN